MRELIKILEQVNDSSNKITRSAFIYLPPKTPKDKFAQCSTCQLFLPNAQRCGIFGKSDVVKASASCGLYLHGKPHDDQPIQDIVTPEQAGYVDHAVRCENCSWYKDRQCDLFKLLNSKIPDAFDCDPNVEPQACCNAWQE